MQSNTQETGQKLGCAPDDSVVGIFGSLTGCGSTAK